MDEKQRVHRWDGRPLSSENDTQENNEERGHGISDSEAIRIKRMFSRMDVNGDKRIDADELEVGLRSKGFDPSPEQIKQLMTLIDRDGKGYANLEDLQNFVMLVERVDLLFLYWKLFAGIDQRKTGYLEMPELDRALRAEGHAVSGDELRNMFAVAGSEDGRIEFDDWIRLLTACGVKDQNTPLTLVFNVWVSTAANPYVTLAVDKKSKPLSYLLAGGLAGAVSRTSVAPLVRLKILLQVQVAGEGGQRKYTGLVQGLRRIAAEEGWRGFYKGNGANVVRIFPTSALQFFAYENYKKVLSSELQTKDLNTFHKLVAGGAAGMTASTMCYPLDFVRARLTVQTERKYRGIFHGLAKISHQEGFFALYRGWGATMMGIVPFIAIDFAGFEFLKGLAPVDNNGNTPAWAILLCGGAAGTIGQTCVYPIDVIRRRMQVDETNTYRKLGVASAIKRVWSSEGVAGLYRGIGVNYAKVAPSIGITFLVYEKLKQWMKL